MKLESAPLVGPRIRSLKRYREILATFSRYGFSELLYSLDLNRFLDPVRSKPVDPDELSRRSRPERLRLALQELGSTFIKLGQLLASRPDLLPLDYIEELHKLEDEVPAEPFDLIEQQLEAELGRPVAELFADFQRKPLAAGSIAQIHRATLSSGEQVVIKIRRPRLRQRMEVDLEIVENLAALAEEHLDSWAVHKPSRLAAQLKDKLLRETDFVMEMANIDRFRHHMGNAEMLVIPHTYPELSSPGVLTMDFIDGVKPTRVEDVVKLGCEPKQVAENLANLVMGQIFAHGFFHADPHAGNVMVLEDNRIAFIDFGLMGSLGRDVRENFADLLYAIAIRDERSAVRALIRLTDPDQRPDRQALEVDVADFMTLHFYRPIKHMRIGRLLHDLVEKTTRHGLSIPMELLILVKAVATLESLVRVLDPEFNLVEEMRGHVAGARLGRYRPARLFETVRESGAGLFSILRDLPAEVQHFLRSLEKGRARIALEHHGLGPLTRTLDQVSNRIAFAIVLAALIVGSSLIMHAGIPPHWHGIPVIGLAGFVIAGLMGMWLLYSILRHGRM